KSRWPIFNYSQKRWEDVYGLFVYEDQKGYQRFAIEKNKRRLNPVHTFHYLVDGHAILRKAMREYNLCPKLCFMQRDPGKCEGVEEGYCFGACEQKEDAAAYNERVQKAVTAFKTLPSFAIMDKGLQDEEK